MKMNVALVADNGDGTGRLVKSMSGPESLILTKLEDSAWQDGIVINVPDGLAIEDYFVPDITAPATLEQKPPPMTSSPPPVPTKVTALQFILAANVAGYINDAEAEAWITKTAVPQVVLDVVAMLPVAEQNIARLRALGMTEVLINDPMIAGAMLVLNLTDSDRDALFVAASNIT